MCIYEIIIYALYCFFQSKNFPNFAWNDVLREYFKICGAIIFIISFFEEEIRHFPSWSDDGSVAMVECFFIV